MKKLMSLAVILLFIISCQKSQTTNSQAAAVLTFMSGDTAYDWSGNDSLHNTQLERISSDSSWWLDCTWKNSMQYLHIGIPMKNLAAGDYSAIKPITLIFYRDGQASGGTNQLNNDQATFVITTLHDNMVDGTFSYESPNGSTGSPVSVTKGAFKNVPVHIY